ncbi:MAG: 50S ribosomal protein L10 [Candidatus Hadarchaeota archaeon]
MASSSKEASVAPWKREKVNSLVEKFKEYPTVGILDISGIPAKQFQQIRDELRGDAEIKVSRKTLLKIAIQNASEDEHELEELINYFEGPNALIFSEINPFKLRKLLDENRTSAPAKVGMEAPEDIVIPEGDTDFSPGPVVGELQQAGVNARIQAGKVVVLEDSKIVEEGEPITEEKVGVLSRFGIEPREIGFEIFAAYSDGAIFEDDILKIDEEETVLDIQNAYMNSLKLSFGIDYPTSESLNLMIGQAFNRARNLSFNATVYNQESMSLLMSKAMSQMLGLSSAVASENPDSIDEELSSKLTTGLSAGGSEVEEEKEEEKEEKAKEEVDEEKEEEEQSAAGLGDLF